jgi:hypothetical protein
MFGQGVQGGAVDRETMSPLDRCIWSCSSSRYRSGERSLKEGDEELVTKASVESAS